MSEHHPADEENICANFARHPSNEGFTEAEFRVVIADLLARGELHRVAYRTPAGELRYRIERAPAAVCGGSACLLLSH
jgi:hypothetical protein